MRARRSREADVGGAGWQQLIDRTERLVDLRGVHARKPLANPGSQAFEFRYERLLCLGWRPYAGRPATLAVSSLI